MDAKKEYKALLDSGELQIMFPDLSGKWIKDKKAFTSAWESNNRAIKNIDVNFDSDE